MRCFRPPRWDHARWKRAWSRCSNVPWAKCFWNVKFSSDPSKPLAPAADATAAPEPFTPVTDPPRRSFSFSTSLLNPLTNLLLTVSLCAVIGGWGGVIFYTLRTQSAIAALLQQPITQGIPSQIVLDEGIGKFPWLKDYKLDQPNVVNGNETLLITSTVRATHDEALEEARQALSLHILQRHHQRYVDSGTLSLARQDLISYFPSHEGTLEKPITVGKFTEPMYRVYLLATIPDSSLERVDAIQHTSIRSRNADLFLGSILIFALALIALVIAFRVDLATQGRRRWIGNLVASAFLLAAGTATIATRLLM